MLESVEFSILLSDRILFQIFPQKSEFSREKGRESKFCVQYVFRITEGSALYSTLKSPVGGNGVTCYSDRTVSKRFSVRWRSNRLLLEAGVYQVRAGRMIVPIPIWPGSKRTGPKLLPHPRRGLGPSPNGGARLRVGMVLPNRARNSKYPKGTPFIPIFLYLNTSNVHSISNMGLNILATF